MTKHQVHPGRGEWTSVCGTGRLNLSREAKSSGTKADREDALLSMSTNNHEQDSQPCPVHWFPVCHNTITYTRYIQGCQGVGAIAPRLFPFHQGFWGAEENGDTDMPSAKECAVVGGGVVFEMQ